MLNLPDYPGTTNIFKHTSVYGKIHAKISKRNEETHGQNVQLMNGLVIETKSKPKRCNGEKTQNSNLKCQRAG